MARDNLEIERKFLVDVRLWLPSRDGTRIRQGYLSSAKGRTVRIRIAGNQAFLTVKGPAVGLARSEFEYEIPLDDAVYMLDHLCERPIIEKTRYREDVGATLWEVDVFHDDNDGLVVAEVELSSPADSFDRPAWVGHEVSSDPRYFNTNLLTNPFKDWPSADE